jgi:hypothetical protein
MILPHDANPGRIEFSETTGVIDGLVPIVMLLSQERAVNQDGPCEETIRR